MTSEEAPVIQINTDIASEYKPDHEVNQGNPDVSINSVALIENEGPILEIVQKEEVFELSDLSAEEF